MSLLAETAGVNWDGVLANVASITVILGVFVAFLTRTLKRAIKDQIKEVIASEVTPALTEITATLRKHDTRIARLEGIEEGRKAAIAQAGISPAS